MGNKKRFVGPDQLADRLRFGDVQWAGGKDLLVWQEYRSDRGVLVAGKPSVHGARDLNREHPARAGVGYGGGDFGVSGNMLFYISGSTIYSQELDSTLPGQVYRSEADVCSPIPSPDEERIIFVESWKDRERLALIAADGGEPLDFHTSSDFNMQPCWHPSGRYLAWITWDHPSMPWENSRMRISQVSGDGCPREIPSPEAAPGLAVFQPGFSPDGNFLACVSDSSGWANLRVYSFPSMELAGELSEPCEHCQPPWVQGMRSYAWTPDSRGIYLIRNHMGFSTLVRYDLETSTFEKLEGDIGEYSSFSQISVSRSGQIAVIASSPSVPPQILITGDNGRVKILRRSLPGDFQPHREHRPDSVSWNCGLAQCPGPDRVSSSSKKESESGGMESSCHGLYYRAETDGPELPEGSPAKLPPAVIRIHGGPTSSYSAEFDPDVRFFTSRGYAVLALNYRGSTGYGREYRELLDGNWGITDVEDVRDAAEFLVAGELADRNRIFLDGGSAGGFTLLLALIRYPGFFRGGICRYGVADLLKLTEDTHRFESHYLDSLIGKLPEQKDMYVERSPVSHIGKLVDPIALFQGSDDKVVPLDQAEVIARELEERGVPHLFRVFEGEGHGWRKKETIKTYFDTVEDFLLRYS